MSKVYCCTCEKNIDEDTLIMQFSDSDAVCFSCMNDNFLDAEDESWKDTASPMVKHLIKINDMMEWILSEDPERGVKWVEGLW